MKTLLLTTLILANSIVLALAEEPTAKLTLEALAALKEKPKTTAPTSLPTKTPFSPPVTETKSEYLPSKGMIWKVVTMSDGSKKEMPAVDIPILFKKDEATLAGDQQTQENLNALVKMILSLGDAKFSVEGHASAEGTDEHNQDLSQRRAETIAKELSKRKVPEAAITRITGKGERFAKHNENASEPLKKEDRKVLVLREN